MKLNTINHPKVLRLRRRLTLPAWGAVGLLESLWHLTAQHAKDGALGKTFTNEDIANAIGWEGDPDQLIDALVSSGWLDVCEVNRLVVHDWHDHCPEFVKGNIRRMKKEFASDPNSVGNSVPYSVPNSVTYSSTVLSSVLESPTPRPIQDQDQDQANSSQVEESSEPVSTDSPPVAVHPVATFPCQGKQKEWHLLAPTIAEWQATYPGLDVFAEIKKARAWIMANPEKRKTARGMPAFLLRWFNRTVDNPQRSAPASAKPPPPAPRPWSEVFAEQEQAQGRLIDVEVRHG